MLMDVLQARRNAAQHLKEKAVGRVGAQRGPQIATIAKLEHNGMYRRFDHGAQQIDDVGVAQLRQERDLILPVLRTQEQPRRMSPLL